MTEPTRTSWQMDADHWRDPDAGKSADRLMVAILTISLAGVCLLISGKSGTELGQRPWHADSILRPVIELMALNHEYPTYRGVEVKWLVQHLGMAAAVLAASVLWFRRTRRDVDLGAADDPVAAGTRAWSSGWTLVGVAQVLWLAFACWMTLSAAWSPWPAASAGEGIRHLITIAGTIAIARSLSRDGVRNGATAMTIVLSVVAALGLWYFYERNPGQRLKFPIGNPIFLAACLLPGLALAGAGLISAVLGLLGRQPQPAETRQNPPAAELNPQSANHRTRRNWLLLIGAGVAIVPLTWALLLADSRGPILGLFFGFTITVYIWRTATSRSRVNLLVMLVIVVVFVVLSLYSISVRGQSGIDTGGRSATLRLRLYAWSYAWDMFKQQPLVGHSQGAYLLQADAMSRLDAERDPLAFPGPMLGHAHNEYLEVLADLGLIGLLLLAGAIVVTLWAAGRALWRITDHRDKWCLLGLLVAFTALLTEEAGSVALRMPGLPLVFHVVLALLWAMSRPSSKPAHVPLMHHGKAIRVVGLAAGIAISAAILALAVRDWHGALADQRAIDLAARQQWSAALASAQQARQHRLVAEDYTEALYQNVRVAHEAALDQAAQLVRMAGRQNPEARISRDILELAEEDTAAFNSYFQHALSNAQFLLERSPTYAYVAGRIGELWLLWREVNLARQQLGLAPVPAGQAWLEQAGQWLPREYARDRLDPRVALQAFSVSADQPLADRFDMLRTAIRGLPFRQYSLEQSGNEFGLDPLNRFEQPLASLMQDPGFKDFLAEKWHTAAMIATIAEPANWPDPYAPETLRLAARANKLGGEFEGAIQQAQTAVELSSRITARYPHAAALARQDLAFYTLLRDPQNSTGALTAFMQALQDSPANDSAERQQALQRTLAVYQLAAGQEQQARQSLSQAGVPEQALDQTVALGYHRLAEAFAGFPLDRRPDVIQNWLDRALELAPDNPLILVLAIRQDLDFSRDWQARQHLAQLTAGRVDFADVQAALQMLLSRYPENELLRDFLRDFAQKRATQPAPAVPETNPSSPSVGREPVQPGWEALPRTR